jgi:HlyD family secretion protein
MKTKTKYVSGIALVAVILGGSYFFFQREAPENRFTFVTVNRQDVSKTITANGTLQPVEVVTVGTTASGVVKKYYVDHAEKVKKGQLLLEIEDDVYRAQLAASEATLNAAKSNQVLARDTVARTKELFDKGYVSKQDFGSAAQQLEAATAQVDGAKANYERDRIARSKTVVRSPVDGVVISRAVEVGQTITASLQTPELYRIAKDLSKMQINSSFAEADISQVKPGMSAAFTVDAFSGEKFEGLVKVIRLNPNVINSVVSYNAVVSVENPDLKLLPGMTAYVKLELGKAVNTLAVPNSALRFRPSPSGHSLDSAKSTSNSTVYIVGPDGEPLAVPVDVGLSDGKYTQVSGNLLQVGQKLITEDKMAKVKDEPPAVRFKWF